ncbi:MAG: TonB-dependent receptor [Caulobacterales bacterium]|nr:TonB-dependent receptor [Caulobacterales bacterium]
MSVSSRRLLFVAVAACALSGAAHAQTQGANTAGSSHSGTVEEVVVTAAPYAVSLETATTSVDVLKREALETAPPAGLGDVLASLPGLRSSANGPGASRPVIRGFSGPRVLVLQNGLGQIDASSLSPDHAVASDPAEASRIEVLRGPSALAYGGSGIGGVVNVIDDRIPQKAPEKGYEGRITASGSTVDKGASIGGGGSFAAGPLVFSLDADHRKTEDYKIPGPPVSNRLAAADGLERDPAKTQRNSDTEVDTYGAGVSFIGEKGFIGVAARKTSTEYGVPYAQVIEDHDHEEGDGHDHEEGPVAIHMNQTRYDLRGQYALDLGPFETIRFSAGKADYEHSEVGRTGDGEVHTTFQSNGTEGRLELVQTERNGWKGAVGLQGLQRDFVAFGEEAIVPKTEVKEAGIFTLQRYDGANWGVDGGLRFDERKLDATLAGRPTSEVAEGFGIDWSSLGGSRSFQNVSASLGGYVKPSDNTFLALAVSHNGRAPTEFELYSDGPHPGTGGFELGNPDLKSEVVVSLEATARWTGERLNIEGHLWGAKYDGFIDRRPTGGTDPEEGLPVFRYVQTDAKFSGMELEAGYALWRSGDKSLRAEAAYDWVRGETDLGAPARSPPPGLTGRLAWSSDRLNSTLEVRHVEKADRLAEFELPTDSYTLVNLSASVKPFQDQDVRLFADIRNLTNEEAREHVSFLKDIVLAPGRSFRAGITYRF